MTDIDINLAACLRGADPSGRFILVASQDADAVEVFAIDSMSGGLTRVDTQTVNCAADVAVI